MPWPMSPPPTTPIFNLVTVSPEKSARGIAAVDIHDLPGAEIRRRRQQVDRHSHQILDLAEPAERNAGERTRPRLLAELIVAIHPGGELGAKHRGRDGV